MSHNEIRVPTCRSEAEACPEGQGCEAAAAALGSYLKYILPHALPIRVVLDPSSTLTPRISAAPSGRGHGHYCVTAACAVRPHSAHCGLITTTYFGIDPRTTI
jgi:hypothetical protein